MCMGRGISWEYLDTDFIKTLVPLTSMTHNDKCCFSVLVFKRNTIRLANLGSFFPFLFIIHFPFHFFCIPYHFLLLFI
jgi:hypothetical protein